MKITLSVYLDTRRMEWGKPLNVMLLMTRAGKSTMIPVGVKIAPSLWDKKTRTVLKCPQKAFFNKSISDKYYAVQEALSKLERKEKERLNSMSIVDIKNLSWPCLTEKMKAIIRKLYMTASKYVPIKRRGTGMRRSDICGQS